MWNPPLLNDSSSQNYWYHVTRHQPLHFNSIADAAFLTYIPRPFFHAADIHSALIFPPQKVLMISDWNVKRLPLPRRATENNNKTHTCTQPQHHPYNPHLVNSNCKTPLSIIIVKLHWVCKNVKKKNVH